MIRMSTVRDPAHTRCRMLDGRGRGYQGIFRHATLSCSWDESKDGAACPFSPEQPNFSDGGLISGLAPDPASVKSSPPFTAQIILYINRSCFGGKSSSQI